MKFFTSTQQQFRQFIEIAELLGLIVVGIATIYAMGYETWKMIVAANVSLNDLLLMFLYLEILAMVIQYFKSGQLPVRFPLYIGIVALARELILNIDKASELHMLASTGAICLLAIGVLLIRYGQSRFPSSDDAMREDS
jgi:protein PsiE